MLERKIIPTEDGSVTIFIPEWNESYHSRHGAVQEAYHVFIRNGLDHFPQKKEISILEIGFGTGLNALITILENQNFERIIRYTGIEKFPVSETEFNSMNYPEILQDFNPNSPHSKMEIQKMYSNLMKADWEEFQEIQANFHVKKIQSDFLAFSFPENEFDLVYFDAFGARVQPELWTEELFEKIYLAMKIEGIFTTYSAKGSVRRALQEVGLTVEKKPGPPGKREMLVAKK